MIIIAALTQKRVIGYKGTLPWSLKQDLAHFKELTRNQVVIMGRRTYESLPTKPLPERVNIVVSSTLEKKPGIEVVASLDAAVKKANPYHKKIYIIGGAQLYKEALPLAKKIYLTYVKKEYQGDIYFPKFNKEEWEHRLLKEDHECSMWELTKK